MVTAGCTVQFQNVGGELYFLPTRLFTCIHIIQWAATVSGVTAQ